MHKSKNVCGKTLCQWIESLLIFSPYFTQHSAPHHVLLKNILKSSTVRLTMITVHTYILTVHTVGSNARKIVLSGTWWKKALSTWSNIARSAGNMAQPVQ